MKDKDLKEIIEEFISECDVVYEDDELQALYTNTTLKEFISECDEYWNAADYKQLFDVIQDGEFYTGEWEHGSMTHEEIHFYNV